MSEALTLSTSLQQSLPNLKTTFPGQSSGEPRLCATQSYTLRCLLLRFCLHPGLCLGREAARCAEKSTIFEVRYISVRILGPLSTTSMTLDMSLNLSLSLSLLICKMGFTYPFHRVVEVKPAHTSILGI